MDSIVVFVAEYFLYLSLGIVGVFWIVADSTVKFQLPVRMALGGVIALALSYVASRLYYDPRPFVTQHIRPLFAHAPDNGFPSDHALLTSFLAFTVWAFSRRVGAVLLLIAVMVGAARVASHVHTPIDILGSFVFSAMAAVVAVAITRALPPRGLPKPKSPSVH